MKIWNRVFLMDPTRQSEASAALVAIHEEVNSVSDYGYNLWETVVGTQGEFGASALVSDVERFTSGELMHADADGEKLGALAAAVNACVDGRPEDSFWTVAHSVGDWSTVPNVVANVVNTLHIEQMADSVGALVEFVDYMHGLSGTPVTVCTSFWGTGPAVRLIWGYESLGDFDERTSRGMSDPGFHERNAAMAATVGPPVVTTSNVMRRLV